jgi:hypothetical protein
MARHAEQGKAHPTEVKEGVVEALGSMIDVGKVAW